MSDAGSAVIIGAAGGIGAALADAIAADGRYCIVHCLARSASPPCQIDWTEEASSAAAARHVQAADVPPRLVVIATGLLHGVGITTGLIQRWGPGAQILRGAGALVMAAGLYFLWGAAT